jgi:prolyl oligopeptidase
VGGTRRLFAVANIRGGLEFGRAWQNGGMLQFKQNVFNDFIAAAEHLTQRGYTKPAKLAIQGASNGGLLVAAAFVQRPELFQAVLCDSAMWT